MPSTKAGGGDGGCLRRRRAAGPEHQLQDRAPLGLDHGDPLRPEHLAERRQPGQPADRIARHADERAGVSTETRRKIRFRHFVLSPTDPLHKEVRVCSRCAQADGRKRPTAPRDREVSGLFGRRHDQITPTDPGDNDGADYASDARGAADDDDTPEGGAPNAGSCPERADPGRPGGRPDRGGPARGPPAIPRRGLGRPRGGAVRGPARARADPERRAPGRHHRGQCPGRGNRGGRGVCRDPGRSPGPWEDADS